MLFGRERSSMPPTARHYKILHWLARSRCQLAFAELLGQRLGIARVANRHCSDRLPAFRNAKDLLGGLRVEAGHLVGDQPLGDSLESEQHGGCPCVVLGVAVGIAIREMQFANSDG